MRLNRFLALAGVASRRGAEDLIRSGRITVNGKVCTELTTQINAEDHVRVDSKIVTAKEFVYLLLNKPAGYVTTKSDDRSRPTIYDLLPRQLPKVAHVGRLDLESEGLLLLTNDGELTVRLTHPRYKVPKEYLVTLDREFDMGESAKVKKGVYLAEGRARFDAVYKINPRQIRVILTQGIKRQVRRVLAALGYKVKRLERTKIGGLSDPGLRPGAFRMLKAVEIAMLKGENPERVIPNRQSATRNRSHGLHHKRRP
jgi:23S rRNA pseudouridine2605 synthase